MVLEVYSVLDARASILQAGYPEEIADLIFDNWLDLLEPRRRIRGTPFAYFVATNPRLRLPVIHDVFTRVDGRRSSPYDDWEEVKEHERKMRRLE